MARVRMLPTRWDLGDRCPVRREIPMTCEDQYAWVCRPSTWLRFRDVFAYHEADQRDAALMYTAGHWRKNGDFTMPLWLNGEHEKHIECGGAVGRYIITPPSR